MCFWSSLTFLSITWVMWWVKIGRVSKDKHIESHFISQWIVNIIIFYSFILKFQSFSSILYAHSGGVLYNAGVYSERCAINFCVLNTWSNHKSLHHWRQPQFHLLAPQRIGCSEAGGLAKSTHSNNTVCIISY